MGDLSIKGYAKCNPDGGFESAGGLGLRTSANQKALYPTSPLVGYQAEELDDETIVGVGRAALNGDDNDQVSWGTTSKRGGASTLMDSAGVVKDGFCISLHDMNYPNAPDTAVGGDVDIEAANIPSPFMPNLASGDAASGTQPVADPATVPEPGTEYGAGLGGLTSPSTTSAGVATQTIGELMGMSGVSGGSRSYDGSGGTSSTPTS